MFNVYCRHVIPYMYLYKHQVEYYEKMVYNILEKDIGMILPKFGNMENKYNQNAQKDKLYLH